MDKENYTTYLFKNKDLLTKEFNICFDIPEHVELNTSDYLFLTTQLILNEINPVNEYCCSPIILKLHLLKTCIDNREIRILSDSIKEHFTLS